MWWCGCESVRVSVWLNRCFFLAGLFFKRVCDMMGIVMANQPAIFEELNAHSRAGQPNKFEFLGTACVCPFVLFSLLFRLLVRKC